MWKKIKEFISKLNKNNRFIILTFIACFIFGLYLNSYSANIKQQEVPQEVSYVEFLEMVDEGKVKAVALDLKKPVFSFQDNEDKYYYTQNPKTADFKEFLLKKGISVTEVESTSQNALVTEIFNSIRFILFFAFGIWLFKRTIPAQRNEEITDNIPNVTFDDIAGCKELKKDMQFIINYLKNPKEYTEMGARMPRGIVLYGPPGTGKTLTAKAIAGTAGVPFFSVSGSDFVEMFVGLGAKRVRDLYKKARKKAPCIVFIDEIDAVGTERGTTNNSERDQTINALLNELDGFNGTEGIVTIAATNRIEDLDHALIRPGRFDKHIAVPLPEREDRLAILKVHAKNKKFDASVKLEDIAAMTVGFSGAALEALLNEAAFIAVNEKKKCIDMNGIDTAFWRIIMKGDKKESHSRDKNELRIAAYHEAGHALATKLLTDDEVPKVTIIASTSGAGGVTFRTPKETSLVSKKYLRKLIQIMYAGRVGEFLLLKNEDEITTGASNDIQQATNLIKQYITTYGMSEKFGMINFNEFAKGAGVLSVASNENILDEASKLSKSLYDETVNLLKANEDILIEIAEELLKKETLNNSEIDEIIKKRRTKEGNEEKQVS